MGKSTFIELEVSKGGEASLPAMTIIKTTIISANICYLPDTILNTWHLLTHLIITTLGSRYYHSYFRDEKTEVQRCRNFPRSSNQ